MCGLVQAGECEFDLRVSVGTVDLAFVGPEDRAQVIRHPGGYVECTGVAGDRMIGDGRFDAMPHHIKFVALLQQTEAAAAPPFAAADLVGGVQIAVIGLRAGDQVHRLVAQCAQLRVVGVRQGVGRLLKPFIDVGVLEHHAMEDVVEISRRHLEIGHRMALAVGKLVAGGVVGCGDVDVVVDDAPLVWDHTVGDLLASCGPERGGDSDVHDVFNLSPHRP